MKNVKRMTIAAAVAFTVMLTGIHPARTFSADVPKPARQYDVRILRDSWGVPHIFGKTDADVAYGLAYAHAQDDFKTMQGILMAVHGRLAELLGPRGGGNDFLVHLIRLWDTVDEKYEKDLSPETRTLCEAYADGVNRYAALHPDEAFKGFYPISGKTIVAGFVHKMPLMVGVDKELMALFADEPPAEAKKAGKDDRKAALDGFPWAGAGSNAIAVSPKRSAGGKTFLAVNSHQPWEGPVSWYEAHLHSDEGWNMVGGLFPGAPLVLHGHNERLGWAHTNNYPDLVDVYTLEINPDNPGPVPIRRAVEGPGGARGSHQGEAPGAPDLDRQEGGVLVGLRARGAPAARHLRHRLRRHGRRAAGGAVVPDEQGPEFRPVV